VPSATIQLFNVLKAHVRVIKLVILDEALGCEMRNLEAPYGEIEGTEGPIVTEIQTAVPPSLRFLLLVSPFCKNNR
jgi:hypothetical protein